MAISLSSVKNFFAIPVGLVFGSLVNMGVLSVGTNLIPPPVGADTMSMEGLKATMHLFQPVHFLSPLLAHALGTLTGAWLAVIMSGVRSMRNAWIIGGFFLAGGVINIAMLPSPVWFSTTDLIVAYLPMAWLGGRAAGLKA